MVSGRRRALQALSVSPLLGLGLACGGAAAPADGPRVARAPDFELDRLDGGAFRLSDHLGREVLLLDFWATFCEPCLTAMPHLDELHRKYRPRGFQVVGISIDGPDSVNLVRSTVKRLGVTFPILLDRETRVVAQYNPKTSAPYSVLIGRSGGIVTQREGYTTGDHAAVERDVQAALA